MSQYCIRNHDKVIVGQNKRGACRLCNLQAAKWSAQKPEVRRRMREYDWKKAEIRAQDGLFFTVVAYDRLYQLQQGCCGVCGIHQSDIKQTLDVDHSHKTGIVRGLLCRSCNLKGRAFEDDIAGRIKAYLGRVL